MVVYRFVLVTSDRISSAYFWNDVQRAGLTRWFKAVFPRPDRPRMSLDPEEAEWAPVGNGFLPRPAKLAGRPFFVTYSKIGKPGDWMAECPWD